VRFLLLWGGHFYQIHLFESLEITLKFFLSVWTYLKVAFSWFNLNYLVNWWNRFR
jgi:hypothetical protein